MKTRSYEVRLSGSGGQGLILAGIILARAAVLDKRRVTQTQSYGPESRGGSSRADVIISDEDIYFPEATSFNCLLALTQEACDKYLFDLSDGGILIIDTTYVKNLALAAENTYELNFTEIAIAKLGSPITTNILSGLASEEVNIRMKPPFTPTWAKLLPPSVETSIPTLPDFPTTMVLPSLAFTPTPRM